MLQLLAALTLTLGLILWLKGHPAVPSLLRLFLLGPLDLHTGEIFEKGTLARCYILTFGANVFEITKCQNNHASLSTVAEYKYWCKLYEPNIKR